MILPFDPILLSAGSLAVRWSGALALVGLGVAVWRSLRQLEPGRAGRRLVLDALAWGLPVGLVFARLAHVLAWWDFYLAHADGLWHMNLDGLSLWGGLLGGGACVLVRLAAGGQPLRARRIMDVVAPNALLGIALGRLGAFLDGHGQGLPTNLPWGTRYASQLAATPDLGVARHPAQLYDALLAVGIWLVVGRLLPGRLAAGGRLATGLVAYAAGRVLLGAVRLDPAFLFGLQLEQLLALAAMAFGIVYGLRPALVRRRPGVEAAAEQARASAATKDSLAA